MISVDRLAIKTALFNLLTSVTFSSPVNGASTWRTTGRRLKLWDSVDTSQQPAMFLVQHREGYAIRGVGQELRHRYLDMGVWCYAPTGGEGIIGDDLLDLMESGIEDVLGPDEYTRGELTLGRLVYWCRITREEGIFIRDPGDIDSQAVLILPIRILLP